MPNGKITRWNNDGYVYIGNSLSQLIKIANYSDFQEVKISVSNGKSAIASAITDKGVSTAYDATFQTMSDNIRSISTISNLYMESNNLKYLTYNTSYNIQSWNTIWVLYSADWRDNFKIVSVIVGDNANNKYFIIYCHLDTYTTTVERCYIRKVNPENDTVELASGNATFSNYMYMSKGSDAYVFVA